MLTTRHLIPVDRWTYPRHRLGVWGEEVARTYLSTHGWAIEAHRFRFGRQEIDLIARHGHLVAFIEVKTRRTAECGTGLEAVNVRKQRIITRVAAFWALRYGQPADIYRFDVIGIQPSPEVQGGLELIHVADGWRL